MKAKVISFFKRRSVIVSTVVIVVLAVTVVTDLPANSTIASQISGDKAVIQEVNADVGPCVFGVKESFQIYDGEQAHSLTTADMAEVPGLLRDDQTACSFTSESIYELTSDIDVPSSASGKPLAAMLGTVTLWATSDALSAIESIQTLSGDPGDKPALSQLHGAERLLASDRAEVESEMEAADKVVGTQLPVVALPALADPASTQGT